MQDTGVSTPEVAAGFGHKRHKRHRALFSQEHAEVAEDLLFGFCLQLKTPNPKLQTDG